MTKRRTQTNKTCTKAKIPAENSPEQDGQTKRTDTNPATETPHW
jgi:hypothetical protein